MNKTALAIHGGAGTILRSEMSPESEEEYRNGLKVSLQAGWEVLQNGGSSLDAVEAAVVELENNPLFNAGRGAVFTSEGKNELDASIMDGAKLEAGAVAFVKNIKNPVKLARFVMEKSEHILLAGVGANEFAKEMNAEFETDEYFHTELRYQQLLKAQKEGVIQLDHAAKESENEFQISNLKSQNKNQSETGKDQRSKIGTVGAVACDSSGNLAAATSTGGMTNKKFGRVGDSPIIGAGNYAENSTCAVSCTGHGEFFMLGVSAYDVAARMKYKNISLEQAARETIEHLTEIGGEGGLIAVDNRGNISLPFNSDGMYRGFVGADSEFTIEIYSLELRINA